MKTEDLVREARGWVARVDAQNPENWHKGYVLDAQGYIEDLCDALEEAQATRGGKD